MYFVYVDEAGRGPIAGPVYVGIIIENVSNVASSKKGKIKNYTGEYAATHKLLFSKYKGYDDSKIFKEQQREELYEKLIVNKNIAYASGSSKSKEIDKRGIVRGIRTSIARAIYSYFLKDPRSGLKKKSYSEKGFLRWIETNASDITLVIDGKTDFGIRKLWGVCVETIVDGDAIVPMISAASIVAKVERDREMIGHAKKFPEYGFAKHKGYGTKAHYDAINQHGMSSLHRTSFLKRITGEV